MMHEAVGVNPDQYEPIFTVDTSDVSYAFNVSTPDSIINRFQVALDKLKASGKIDEVFKKYEGMIVATETN